MNEQAIQEQYQHIVTLLKQQRLKEAQSQLEAFLWNSGDWTLRNRLEQSSDILSVHAAIHAPRNRRS